jgi:tripartite-type tricarboxylate transporter receptor subunit TctC
MKTVTALAAAAILAAAVIPSGASAQDAEKFFKGKTITITVGYGAGGGYANYCRQLVGTWSKYIVGNPTVVCAYMPGGGGVKAANYMYNVAPKNGNMLSMISDYAALAQLLEPKKVKYDIRKFKWVGIMVPANPVLMVRKGAKVQSWDDNFKAELIVGLTGVLAQDGINCRLMNTYLGTKMRLVPGYASTPKIALAMEKGEVDASLSSWISWKTRAKSQLAKGEFIPIAQIGVKKAWDLPNLPLVSDFAKSDEAKAVMALAGGAAPFGRSVTVPPGYPAHLLAALRKGFDATMKDKDFLASAKKRNIEIDPMPGAEIEPILAKIMATPPAIVAAFRKAAGLK